jgi:hypothetical protein
MVAELLILPEFDADPDVAPSPVADPLVAVSFRWLLSAM